MMKKGLSVFFNMIRLSFSHPELNRACFHFPACAFIQLVSFFSIHLNPLYFAFLLSFDMHLCCCLGPFESIFHVEERALGVSFSVREQGGFFTKMLFRVWDIVGGGIGWRERWQPCSTSGLMRAAVFSLLCLIPLLLL